MVKKTQRSKDGESAHELPVESKNLYLRNGVYYLNALVHNVPIRQSLHTGDLAEARMLRDAKLSVLRAHKDERSLLEYVQRQLTGIRKEEEEASANVAKGPRLSAAWELWERDPCRRDCKATQVDNHRRNWNDFLEWMQNNHPQILYCRDVTRGICQEWAADAWANTRSINNYNKKICSVRYVFSSIIRYDEQCRQPMELIHRKKDVDAISKEPFTDDELRAIFGSLDDEFVRLCAIGLYTTLRFSDARSVTWEMLDRGLSVLEAVHHKTGADASQLIAPELREILNRVPMADRHGLVCPTYGGLPKSAAIIRMQNSLQAIGIRTTRQVVGKNGELRNACVKGFHSFRHTAITLALRHGAGVAQVKRLAGHASEGMQARYTHMGEEDAGFAASKIGKFW